jgi:putative ATPase
VGDLFSEAARRRLDASAPLAQRLRPATLDDFAGQDQVIGPGRALRLAIEADRVPSMILFGPPGSGKTTLARIVAHSTGAEFAELSAVSATVANVRQVLAEARERLGASGRRTILFLDEIHRFNKAQQDALLPGVEDGLVTLIGATTENPYFEVNSALLSRTQIYELEPHSDETLREVVRRGAAALGAEVRDDVEELIARRAGGDARNALNILELATKTADAEGVTLETRHVDDAARKRPLVYDKGGDAHYDFISAWIKATRAGDVQASVYYLAAMLEGGEDGRFIARRMIVLASEDIGNADPQALLVAVAAAQAVEHVGLPEARLNLAQAAVYLARAPKSNASYRALGRATEDVRERGHLRPPDALRSASHPGSRKLGRGQGYLYPHDDPRGFEVDCLPEELAGTVYYEPSGIGEEAEAERSARGRRPPPPRTDPASS